MNYLQYIFASFEAIFMTGIRDWIDSAKLKGLRDVEIELFRHYITKYSPVYVFKDRIKTNYHKDNFVYGEIPYGISRKICKTANITEKDVVYDLGCGRGKFLFFVNLFTGARCIGVDLLPTYINIAEKIIDKLELRKIHFFEEDILDVDLRTASVVFVHGTTFSFELREIIMDKIDQLKPGSRFISVTKKFDHPKLKLFTTEKFLLSWGLSTMYFYEVTCEKENP